MGYNQNWLEARSPAIWSENAEYSSHRGAEWLDGRDEARLVKESGYRSNGRVRVEVMIIFRVESAKSRR